MYYRSQQSNYVQFILDGDRYFETLTRLIGILYNSAVNDRDPVTRGQRNWIDFGYWSVDPNLILSEGILPRHVTGVPGNYMANLPNNLPTHENIIPGARAGRNGMTLKGALYVLAQLGVKIRIFMWKPIKIEAVSVIRENLAICQLWEQRYSHDERLTGGIGGVQNVIIYPAVYHGGLSASYHMKMTTVCTGGQITVLSGGLNLQNGYASPPQHTNAQENWHDTGYLIRGDVVLSFMTVFQEFVEQWETSHRRHQIVRSVMRPIDALVNGLSAMSDISGPEVPAHPVFRGINGRILQVCRNRKKEGESWGFEGPPFGPDYDHWNMVHTYNNGGATNPALLGSGAGNGYGNIHACPVGHVEVCTTQYGGNARVAYLERDIKKLLIELLCNAVDRIYIENFLLHDAILCEILAEHIRKSTLQDASLRPVPGNPPIPLDRIVIVHQRPENTLKRNAAFYTQLSVLSSLTVDAVVPWRMERQTFQSTEWRWHAGRLNTDRSGFDYGDTPLTIEGRTPLPNGTTRRYNLKIHNVLNAEGNLRWYTPNVPDVHDFEVHSKLIVVDGKVFIGTANFNYRSLNYDAEISSCINSLDLANEALQMLADHWGLPQLRAGEREHLLRYERWAEAGMLRPFSLNSEGLQPQAARMGWKLM